MLTNKQPCVAICPMAIKLLLVPVKPLGLHHMCTGGHCAFYKSCGTLSVLKLLLIEGTSLPVALCHICQACAIT